MTSSNGCKPIFLLLLASAAVFGCLYLISRYNYLLFHTLVEVFSVVIACGVFMLAWHARQFLENDYLLAVGIGFLGVATVDILHTLAYAGMGIIPAADANLPTQLWVASRALLVLAFLLAPIFLTRRLPVGQAVAVFGLTTTLLLVTIFDGVFPTCFIPGQGLTPFKRASEIALMMLFLLAAARLYARRQAFEPKVVSLLCSALLVMVPAESFFTFYRDVTGLANFLGHCTEVVAFALIYRAVLWTGFVQPHNLLYRDLAQRERDLRAALAEVKRLSGLLPICVSCKQIRNDQGYWQQVEVYIAAHTDAQFSHSLCPACATRLYPELFSTDAGAEEKDLVATPNEPIGKEPTGLPPFA